MAMTKLSAERRRCRECGRKAAMVKQDDGERECRWCGWSTLMLDEPDLSDIRGDSTTKTRVPPEKCRHPLGAWRFDDYEYGGHTCTRCGKHFANESGAR